MYFKLFSCIYPASDFRHEVITPAMLFASQIYSSCSVTNHRDVAVGLMLTTIMAEVGIFKGSCSLFAIDVITYASFCPGMVLDLVRMGTIRYSLSFSPC